METAEVIWATCCNPKYEQKDGEYNGAIIGTKEKLIKKFLLW
jgi:hypothetical protein